MKDNGAECTKDGWQKTILPARLTLTCIPITCCNRDFRSFTRTLLDSKKKKKKPRTLLRFKLKRLSLWVGFKYGTGNLLAQLYKCLLHISITLITTANYNRRSTVSSFVAYYIKG